MITELRTRTYGYVRASTDKQVDSPTTQEEIIRAYCAKIGRPLDGMYIDPDTSGKLHMIEREAGGELMHVLRKGDHVIVARMDRLSRSFIGFAKILENWEKMQIILHMNDMGVLDPSNPLSCMLIQMLVVFAEYERKMIGVRTREGLQAKKARGERTGRWAEMGYRFVKGKDGKEVKIPDWDEQEFCLKIVEMRAQGYSVNQIRQYISYVWKRKTRIGTVHTSSSMTLSNYINAGLKFLQMQDEGDPDVRPRDMPINAPPYRGFRVDGP